MFKLENVLQLKENEDVRMVSKRHAITLLPSLLFACILIAAPFFFLFPLFSTGPTGIVAFLVLVVVGFILAWRTFATWDGDALIITSDRIIKVTQTGIFSRTVNEIAAENVSEASWEKKGFIGHLCNYGNVLIGSGKKCEAKNVPKPQEVHALIQEIVDTSKKERTRPDQDRSKRIERVQDMLEEMDDATLRKIERLLKTEDRTETVRSLFQTGDTKKESERDISIKKLFGSSSDTNKLKPLDE